MYNGFLFQGITWQSLLMWCGVVLALIVGNELTRSKKWVALFFFVLLPIVLPLALWVPYTATPGTGTSTGTWFHWVKVYSAIAGCLGFMVIRYNPNIAKKRWALLFPPLILSLNIFEACIRDIQVYGLNANGQIIDGVVMMSGPWNIMNAVAGLLNIATISGWMGITISADKKQDMVWPDMKWWWIIAYDLWNFAYVYNCVSDHSFYAGAALLVACTIPAFLIKKGAWLQHRAHTLALWMMFTMSVPWFVESDTFGVASSHDPVALMVVSGLSLAANLAVACYHFGRIVKYKIHPLKSEVYSPQKALNE